MTKKKKPTIIKTTTKSDDFWGEVQPKKKPIFEQSKVVKKSKAPISVGGVTEDMLNDEQKAAIDKIKKFAHSDERQMVFGGFAGTGKCLSGDSLVWMNDKLSSICRISPENAPYNTSVNCNKFNVLTFDKVTGDIFDTPIAYSWRERSINAKTVSLSHGYEITGSPWHPIWCFCNGKFDYLTTTEIYEAKVNGFDVYVPIKYGHDAYLNHLGEFISVDLSNGSAIEITESIAYVVGCLIGDGSLTNSTKNKTRITIGDDDSELVDIIDAILVSHGQPKLRRIGNTITYSMHFPDLVSLLHESHLCTTACYKKIPWWIIESPVNVMSAFLRGLFDTDATSNDGYIEYSTCSNYLSKQVQNILCAYGIPCSRDKKENSTSGTYRINIMSNAHKFYELIGFSLTRKQVNKNILKQSGSSNWKAFPPEISVDIKRLFESRNSRDVVDSNFFDKCYITSKNSKKLRDYYSSYIYGYRCPSYDKINEFLSDMNVPEDDNIRNYTRHNQMWHKVVSVDDTFADLYDIGVSDTHSFIANGAINHNTTVTRFVLDYLDNTSLKTICCAPTNEAVRVLSVQSGRDYEATIYGLLGLVLVQEDDSTPHLRVMGECRAKDYDIVIIDECSMIPSNLYIMIDSMLNQFSHVKIVYIGDPAQLPPVNEQESKVFLIHPSRWAFLSKIQRTAANNPIIKYATLIRENLLSPVDVFPHVTELNEETGHGVKFFDDREEFLNTMYEYFKTEDFKNNPNYVRAMAYTNAAVNALNKRIRTEIYGDGIGEYVEGEIIMVDVPIMDETGYNIMYTVGERLRVLDIELLDDEPLGIKYWSAKVVNYEAKTSAQTTTHINIVHQNYEEKYRQGLTRLATEAKKREIELGNKKDAWKPYFSRKHKFSWVKYIYAITVHKSQGSTYTNAFVVNKDMDKLRWNHSERNRLKYVAFTRPSQRLFIY